MADLIRRGDALDAVHEADSLEMAQFGGNVIADRIAALPAVTPAVKVNPLVWCDLHKNGTVYATREDACLFGYAASIRLTDKGCWAYGSTEYRDVEAAKAAAQADYEARILSALDVTPAPTLAEVLELPEVKALVDAAKPYVSPMQNADYGRQLRQYEALVAALRRISEARHD